MEIVSYFLWGYNRCGCIVWNLHVGLGTGSFGALKVEA